MHSVWIGLPSPYPPKRTYSFEHLHIRSCLISFSIEKLFNWKIYNISIQYYTNECKLHRTTISSIQPGIIMHLSTLPYSPSQIWVFFTTHHPQWLLPLQISEAVILHCPYVFHNRSMSTLWFPTQVSRQKCTYQHFWSERSERFFCLMPFNCE